MKNTSSILIVLTAAALYVPASKGAATVAVFDFKTSPAENAGAASDDGKLAASALAADLADLAPVRSVSRSLVEKWAVGRVFAPADQLDPAQAREIGRSLSATSLVMGQVYVSAGSTIVAAKVVSVKTGEAHGAMVKGGADAPMGGLLSRLGLEIAAIALDDQGMKVPAWAPATIIGSHARADWTGTNIPGDTVACVLAIDGRLISDASAKWGQELPVVPGRHEIAIVLRGEPTLVSIIPGRRTGANFAGRTPDIGRDFVFDAKPGVSYEIVYEKPEAWVSTYRNAFTTDPDLLLREKASGRDVPVDEAASRDFVVLNGESRPNPKPKPASGASSEKTQGGGAGAGAPTSRDGTPTMDQRPGSRSGLFE